jgi:hypothetical protein
MALTELQQEIVAKARGALRAMARTASTTSDKRRRPRASSSEEYIDAVIAYLLAHGGDAVASSDLILKDAFDTLATKGVYAKAAAQKKLHAAMRVAFSQYRRHAKPVEVEHGGELYRVSLTITPAATRDQRRFTLRVERAIAADEHAARASVAAKPSPPIHIALRVFAWDHFLHAYPFLPVEIRERVRSCIWEISYPTGETRRERAGVSMSHPCTIPGTYQLRAYVFLDAAEAPAYIATGSADLAAISSEGYPL